jgi:flagellar hook-length control protein FliK
LVSVSSEAVSNLVFHGAAQRPARSIQHPANDLFDALVGDNTAPDTASPPQPSPCPRRSDETQRPSDATGAKGASNPPPNNDPTNAVNAGPPPSNANSDDGDPTGGDATQPSSATKSASAKDQSPKSPDEQVSSDSPAADPTALTQEATTTTTIPVAVAVPASAGPINVPTTATAASGTTTPPLAIAAAAIAASSQTISAPGATPAQGNGDSDKGPTTPPAAVTKALSAPGIKIAASEAANAASASPVIAQARQIGTAATDAVALTSAVAATVPVAPKTTSATTSSPSTTTDETSAAESSAINPAAIAQNGLLQQASAAGKAETAGATVEPALADAGAASTSPVSAHEHSGIENAARVLSDPPDPAAQTVAALQPQLGSSTPTTALGRDLSVTAATHGPVPLSGLALEIAASVKSGKSRFEIRLDPPELGRIDVRIDIDRNGQVTSHLTVEKAETLSILRQDAPQLQRALDDAGLKTGSGGLQFSLRDQSSSGQNNGNNTLPNAQRLIIAEEDPVPAAVAGRTYGRPLAGSGGVDIRV